MLFLKNMIEKNDTISGKIFDLFIQILIITSIISFSIETLPDLSLSAIKFLYTIELICIVIFTIEYLLRIIVSDKKLKFFFSFHGIVDLIAILPFYVLSGVDLRSIRILRLFKLLRIFKLLRYNKALESLLNAFKTIKEELLVFIIATLFLIYIASVGIYYFEHAAQPHVFQSVFHSMWWAVATLTTVGYGDVYPITVGGKIFTFTILVLGLGIIAIPSGLIASALIKNKK